MSARISANKLAELLTTPSATRRRRIVYDQKHPSDVIVARYRHALAPIAEHLTAGDYPATPIDQAIVRLRADNSGTAWAMEDRQCTADALEHVLHLSPALPRDGITYVSGDPEATRMLIDNVSVSVRPDFILTSERKGKKYCGALKFHFIKSDDSALQKKGAEFVTVLMHEWLRQFGPPGTVPRHEHCISIDVFRRALVAAPRSITRRWDEIVAGCQEVAARWPQL